MTQHLVDGHELQATCAACHTVVIVGGYVDDIDPTAYRCLNCRPVKPEMASLFRTPARAKATR